MTRAEAAAGAGQDDDPNLRIEAHGFELGDQPLIHSVGQGVQGIRPVQRQSADAFHRLVSYDIAHQASTLQRVALLCNAPPTRKASISDAVWPWHQDCDARASRDDQRFITQALSGISSRLRPVAAALSRPNDSSRRMAAPRPKARLRRRRMSSEHKWLKSTETIAFDVTDRVARITLNRPEKRNALSGRMLQEIHEALLEADDRIDVNVILLRGEGRDFCAGYDLTDSYGGKDAGKPDHDPAFYRTRSGSIDDDIWQLERQQELTLVMLDLHKPIIAKIQGNCLAGGTDLAFSCDIVLAADDAKIGF